MVLVWLVSATSAFQWPSRVRGACMIFAVSARGPGRAGKGSAVTSIFANVKIKADTGEVVSCTSLAIASWKAIRRGKKETRPRDTRVVTLTPLSPLFSLRVLAKKRGTLKVKTYNYSCYAPWWKGATPTSNMPLDRRKENTWERAGLAN